MKTGAFPFFAADHADFDEDTPDGKGATHGTIIAMYQRVTADGQPLALPLDIVESKSLTVSPYHVPVLEDSKPKPQTVKGTLTSL